jgi:predicted AAA+ superfamily ATPase
LPLTLRELAGEPVRPLRWESDTPPPRGEPPALTALWTTILRGFYPEIARDPSRDARLWQASYVQTYIERDVRSLRSIGDLGQFHTFLRALAARATQLLNLSDLARDVGIAVSTARDWLSILEATFQVFQLRPFHANLGKRLVKTPKVYFTDTGLLAYLTGLRDAEHAAAGPMGGPLFENLVVAEAYKSYLHRGDEPPLHFWRTAAGDEVDLLIEQAAHLVPVEVKATATPRPRMASTILRLRQDLGERVTPGYVVHAGSATLPLGEGTLAVSVNTL